MQTNITDKEYRDISERVYNDRRNRGQTINKATVRLEEIINTTNNVNTMIEDCFGRR